MSKSGAELRDEGIDRAGRGAGDNWKTQALQFVIDFPEEEFMAEEVREYAYKNGLDRPPHERAWGGVLVSAKSQGIIERIGFRSVTNPLAHRTPASVWRKCSA